MRWTIFHILLASAGCATAPPVPVLPSQGPFGPEQSFTGVLGLGFERQSFDGCWLSFKDSAFSDLARLAPSPALTDQTASYVAEVTLVGRRRDVLDATDGNLGEAGFGHLGMYPCLVEAARITAARAR
jgi:hypothetical protein